MIIQKKTANIVAIIVTISVELPKWGARTTPIPRIAKAVFSERENQLANPAKVPKNGPMLRFTKKYAPPDFGIAVASSVFANNAGITSRAARRYAMIIPGPAVGYTTAGRINRPELIIAPLAREKISRVPRVLFNVSLPPLVLF